jgi:group I intron endonuclease
MTIIYKYTNHVNGKVYVGKTNRTLQARQREHVYASKVGRNIHWGNALKKWGVDSFRHEILCEVEDSIGALVEMLFIAALHSSDKQYGYNSTDGGEGVGGWHHTLETRRRIGESVRKNPTGFFIKHPTLGKMNPETVLKRLRARYGANYVPKGESVAKRIQRREQRAATAGSG